MPTLQDICCILFSIWYQLAHSKSKIIRQYVASNSNTPVEILSKLSQEFPEEITANPIFN